MKQKIDAKKKTRDEKFASETQPRVMRRWEKTYNACVAMKARHAVTDDPIERATLVKDLQLLEKKMNRWERQSNFLREEAVRIAARTNALISHQAQPPAPNLTIRNRWRRPHRIGNSALASSVDEFIKSGRMTVLEMKTQGTKQ